MDSPPTLILIAGVSCSGKTTLARRLAEELGGIQMGLDDYYRPFDHVSLETRKKLNFDAPESIDHELMLAHIHTLRQGRPIPKPRYDFAAFARLPVVDHIEPAPLLIVEGLFSLWWNEFVSLADLRIFVDTDLEVCRQRRLEKETVAFGRTEDEATQRYATQVLPNQEKYVLPTKPRSDMVVCGASPFEPALAEIAGRFRRDAAYAG